MKTLFAFVCLLLAAPAFAAPVKTACTFQSYQNLEWALNHYQVNNEALKKEVLSVLKQEMGPVCLSVIDLNSMGIPGNKYATYELHDGDVVYTIRVVIGGVEEAGQRKVYLTKLLLDL